MNLTYELANTFGKAIVDESNVRTDEDFAKRIIKASLYRGWFIPKSLWTTEVLNWLSDEIPKNYNATFYKTWDTIAKSDEFELRFHQILHYFTTYGTDFSCDGNGYVVNNNPKLIPHEKLKVLIPTNAEELFEDIEKLIYSPVAMSEDTTEMIALFIKKYNYYDRIDLSKIVNKELLCKLSVMFKLIPDNEFDILRCMVCIITGNANIIKDGHTEIAINRNSNEHIELLNAFIESFNENHIVMLSKIFFRYKKIFLMLRRALKKNNEKNSVIVINKIRRLADKNKKPFVAGYWETFMTKNCKLSAEDNIEYCKNHIDEVTNFKKIQYLQTLYENYMRYSDNFVGKSYNIRNGKLFVNLDKKAEYNATLEHLRTTIRDSLVKSLSNKACNIMLPNGIKLACPTSDKNFIGDYPLGSYMDINKENGNILGIYWKNEWGAQDLDLHMIDDKGNHIGWNSAYRNDGVYYSGDMTNADPEATELLYIDNEIFNKNASVTINQYCGDDKYRLRFFVAKDNGKELINKDNIKDYMVNPNDIVFEIPLEYTTDGYCGGGHTIANIIDHRLYLSNRQTTNNLVPNVKMSQLLIDQQKYYFRSFIMLEDILKLAGFNIVNTAEEADIVIDNKAKLIDLFN